MTLHERLWLLTVDNSRLQADLQLRAKDWSKVLIIWVWMFTQTSSAACLLILVLTLLVAAVNVFHLNFVLESWCTYSGYTMCTQCVHTVCTKVTLVRCQLANPLSGRFTLHRQMQQYLLAYIMHPLFNLLFILLPTTFAVELPYIRCF